MDKIDIRILSHLINNCRTPDSQIGKKIGISGSAVKSRILKMMERKIIEEYMITIEPTVLGHSVLYFVVTGSDLQYILDQIKNIGEPFFIAPCIGRITVCGIAVKENPEYMIKTVKNVLSDIRVIDIFEDKKLDIRADLTRTDIEIIEILLKEPRLKIEEIAKISGFSAKTVTRSLDKLQNDESIRFRLAYNPRQMKNYIPFVILSCISKDHKKIFHTLQSNFSNSFLQRPFVYSNHILLFLYSDDIFTIDDIMNQINNIDGVESADLYVPKEIKFTQGWIKNAIEQIKKSKRFHIISDINSF